jgi:outer membrane receptor protein involved in Fe transport
MRVAIVAAASLSVIGLASADDAKAAIRKPTRVPAEGLAPALATLAKEFDFQVLYRTEVVGKLSTQGASGAMTAAEALEHVLSGTGLTYRYLDDKTVTILPVSSLSSKEEPGGASQEVQEGSEGANSSAKEGKKSSSGEFRMAQVDPGKTADSATVNKESQTSDRGAVELEEIVVTALKRATNLQDTPLAITAVTGNTLTAMGVTDVASLNRVSPGLIVTQSGLSGSRLTLRNIRAAGEATVGLYYDDTPVVGSAGVTSDAGGTTPSIRLFDIDRVEVLRGPQGTLYGSSSMAGTVRLIFAKPKLDETEATITAEGTDVAHGGAGYQTQAMVNVPIIGDKLAVRAVGFYQYAPGYVDNLVLHQNGVNEHTTDGGRLTVRAEPIDGLTIDGLAVVQNSSGALDDYFLADGAYNQNYEALQPVRDNFQLFSGTLNWDVGPVRLTGIVSHTHRNFNYSYDQSAFFRTYAALFPVGSANNIGFTSQAPAVANSPQISSTDTAEVRLASNDHGPLQWTTGFYYSNREGNFDSNVLHANPVTGEPLLVSAATLEGQRVIGDALKQYAGFAEGAYDITERLSMTGGIRYFDYTRRTTNQITVPDKYVGFTALTPIDATGKEHGFLYKADISYKFTDYVLGYVTAASGERPGGVNQILGLPANLQTYQSDSLWNYELGLKSELLDRKLVFNADVYQINWSNMQTGGTLPNTTFGIITNAGSARVRGTEIEATLYPVTGLQLQAAGSYSDAILTQNQTNQTLVAPGVRGDPIPFVPKVTAQVSAQYSWALSPAYKATLRADANYNGSSWTQFPHTNAFQQYLPSYETESLRATLSGPADWNVSAFVNNLSNSSAVTNKLSSTLYGGLNNVRAISLVPRMIGIEVTKHF